MTIDINELENRVEEHLMSGLLDHYRAHLARKHGRRRLADRWFAEVRTRIDRELVVTLLHTVHRSGERRRAYERCVSKVKSNDAVLRATMARHVEEELGVPSLTHLLDDADTAAFWKRVTDVVDDCLNDLGGEVEGGPRVPTARSHGSARSTARERAAG
jgi:hypothetical protein